MKQEMIEASAIIQRHLNRKKEMDEYRLHDTFSGTPKFAVALCEELRDWIARDDVTLDQIVRMDLYSSGHIDYADNLALRCYCLKAFGYW